MLLQVTKRCKVGNKLYMPGTEGNFKEETASELLDKKLAVSAPPKKEKPKELKKE